MNLQFFRVSAKTVYWVLCAAFIAASLLFLTWIRVTQIHLGYRIAQFEQTRFELGEKQKVLELELATLKRPERIKQIAEHKLNLQLPTDKQMLRLKKPGGAK